VDPPGSYPLTGAARRRAIVTLACVLGLEAADVATVGATAGPLQRAMHISHTELGLVASLSLAVTALTTLPAGGLVDRVDRSQLLTWSVVLWSGTIVLIGAAQSFTMLAACRLLLGVASAAVWPAVASLVGDLFDSQERSRVWARILAGELLGTGLGFLLGGNAAAAVSWRASFWVLSLPAAVVAYILWRHLPEPRRTGSSTNHPDHLNIDITRAVVRVVRVRTNVLLIVSSVLAYFFFAGERMFGAEYLHGRYGIGTGLASTLLVVIGSGSLIGVFAGGMAADRLRAAGRGAARITVAAGAYVGCAVLFVPGLLAPSLLMAAPVLFAAAGVLEAAKAPGDAARLDIMPPRLWGRAEGVRTLLRTLAQAAAPTAFGLLADSLGAAGGRVPVTAHHARGLELSLLIMLGPLLISGAVLFRARHTYPRDVARVRRASPRRAPSIPALRKAA
jgi:predicted MFS family arabinose efflux permease